jgi:hypothetical protein
VSSGIYPGKGYDVLEFGGCKQTPVFLTEPHIQNIAFHFPTMCAEMCNDRQYKCVSEVGEFSLSTTKAYRTARLKFGNYYILYRLHELQNPLRILYLGRN